MGYLEFEFQMEKQDLKNDFQHYKFDLSSHNKLHSLFEIENTFGFIGIYDGRKEGTFTLKNTNNGIFVFVINGAFEIEDRLLEAKDGLAIKKTRTIEWESLSQNAMLLVIEVPLNSN
ncbi:hypothetical protein D3C87_1812330 [compost metagenome]